MISPISRPSRASRIFVGQMIITGFPGETEEEFSETLSFLRQCAFAEMHIFPYSIRPGTPAAAMEQVPGPVKEERAARAAAAADKMHLEYLQNCVGRIFNVLYEQPRDGLFQGHAENCSRRNGGGG